MTTLNRREALAAALLTGVAATLPAWAAQQAAAPDGALWDLSEIYPSEGAWDTARKGLVDTMAGMDRFKGRLGESAAVLAQALALQSDINRTALRVYAYASLKADEDVRVSAWQERNAQVTDLFSKIGEQTAWVAPELLTIGKAKIDSFVAANEALRTRFNFLLANILRQAPHTLDPAGEALLASASAPLSAPGQIADQLRSSDIPWPTIRLSTGMEVRLDSQGYTLHRDAPNREDRRAVFAAFWKTHGDFRNSFGATYLAKVKGNIFSARARKYPSALAAALSSNNIPETVYRTLVAETNKGLPELHRYFELRRRLLKLPDVHYYDIYPPLVSLDNTWTIEQMRTITLDAVKPLGADYVKRLSDATAARWMDPWPRQGKSPGAYMNPAAYDVHPYLLLNLSNSYDGLSTYAHEWGHALHSLLASTAQPYEKADYPIFTAEIASTLLEELLAAKLLQEAKTREEKLFYVGMKLENYRATYFRQTMFAEFELTVHDRAEAGEGLSGERFSEIYFDLLRRYHGQSFGLDASYGNEWAYIPHFYNSFYVYQYSTCIAAATYFAQSILKGGAKERDNYLSLLKSGGSDYPVELIRRAGLDMASPAPYQAVIAEFRNLLDQAESLAG